MIPITKMNLIPCSEHGDAPLPCPTGILAIVFNRINIVFNRIEIFKCGLIHFILHGIVDWLIYSMIAFKSTNIFKILVKCVNPHSCTLNVHSCTFMWGVWGPKWDKVGTKWEVRFLTPAIAQNWLDVPQITNTAWKGRLRGILIGGRWQNWGERLIWKQ